MLFASDPIANRSEDFKELQGFSVLQTSHLCSRFFVTASANSADEIRTTNAFTFLLQS
jgi:hypothetical protein